MKTLSIKHLNKNKILNDINLDIEAGEIVALVGPNGSFLEIIQVLLKSFLIFMLSLLMYVQFIQLLSLVLKDEIITWFAVIMISLVSCFVITGWNPFSYILSFDIDFYYEKALILLLINLLIPFISCVFIENMDFE